MRLLQHNGAALTLDQLVPARIAATGQSKNQVLRVFLRVNMQPPSQLTAQRCICLIHPDTLKSTVIQIGL